jgi:SNF2 family DNA or RNA helicase
LSIKPWLVLPDSPHIAATCHLPDEATAGLKAARVTLQGVPLTVLPHDYRTWRTLRDRGVLAPSPLCRYRWSGPFTPRDHQPAVVQHYLENDKTFDFSGMRTGKTLSALWAMDFLMEQGEVGRTLVVCPVSITDIVWERHLFQHFPHRKIKVLSGSRAQKQKDAANRKHQVLIVNPESLHLVKDHLPGVGLVIVDEFTKFKNRQSKLRYPALHEISQTRRLWMLGALPAPQRPTDAYGPLRLVNPEYIGFMRFRALTMYQASKFTWRARRNADEVIAQWMKPAIRYRREDCIDIPDFEVAPLEVKLSDEQKRILHDLKESAATELAGRPITAANAASVLSKALQVMAGGLYVEDSDAVTGEGKVSLEVNADPFYEALEQITENTEGATLFFTGFVNTAEYAADFLKKRGYRVGLVTGNTPKAARMPLFDAVQNGELDALVAVPGTMSHGLELTASNVVVWMTPPFEYEIYDQANHRVLGESQKRKVLILHLVQNTIASERFRALQSKETLQGSVLKWIEGRMAA